MTNEMKMSDLRDQLPAAAPTQQAVSVAVAQEREVAEVQAAMAIAKRFPRDQRHALDRVINACSRPGLAEAALYTYARGGTEITGPSIRMAEAIAQSWGNLQAGVRELEQRDGVSTVETYAWDLETNFRESKVFQVAHERHTKQGVKRLTDPRDIYELVANQGARRLRACILAVIPGDVIDAAVRQSEMTLAAKAEVTPDRIKSLLEKFAEFGVTKEQIEKRIQRRIDTMTPAQMLNLGKVYNSLRDGMSKPAEWFEALSPAEQVAAKAADTKPTAEQKPLKAAEQAPPVAAKAEPAKAEAPPKAAAEKADDGFADMSDDSVAARPEQAAQPAKPTQMTFEEYKEFLSTADTVEQINTWGAKIKDDPSLTADQVKKLRQEAGARVKALQAAPKATAGGSME